MREYIESIRVKELIDKYEENPNCCFLLIDGEAVTSKEDYFHFLKKKLQLNDSYSNNYSAYSDMMRDGFTYYEKPVIVFLITHYDSFLHGDGSKKVIEKIFDQDIIPYFQSEENHKELHIYCSK